MLRPVAALALATCALLATSACTTGTPAPSQSASAPPATTPSVAAQDTPAPTPTPTPTVRPAAISESDAMASRSNYTVVWLAVADADATATLDPVRARASDEGYDAPQTPVGCVLPAPVDLVRDDVYAVWGVPLYFATRADADAFVDLWAEPVVRVIDDVHLGCDWD